MVDHDHVLLNLQLARLEFIAQCSSLEDESAFCNNVRSRINPALDDRRQQSLSDGYLKHKGNLENYHPFSSDGRLSEVKAALEKLTITPVHCSLFSQADIIRLADILKKNNAEITLLNLTNAMEYDYEFQKINLFSFEGGKPAAYKHVKQCLPISNRSLCVFSALTVNPHQTRICSRDPYWRKIDELIITDNVKFVEKRCDDGKRENPSWLDALQYNLVTSFSSRYPQNDESRVKSLLANANEHEIKQLSSNRYEIEQQICSEKRLSTEKQSEILGWINDTISFWEQENHPEKVVLQNALRNWP